MKPDKYHGDYFVDIDPRRESLAKSLVGVWVNVVAAVIAYCVQATYRSHVKRQLNRDNSGFDFWRISLPRVTGEVWEIRSLLGRALRRGHISFVLASLACVAAALLSAASTVIANNTIVTNVVTRPQRLSGRLAGKFSDGLSGAAVNISSRVHALDRAGAPRFELFDFIPEDTSGWVFHESEWNNTWRGNCTLSNQTGVDLAIGSGQQSDYQDFVPLLGNYLPQWAATIDQTRQAGVYTLNSPNADIIFYFIFGSAPSNSGLSNFTSTNISLVNFYSHNFSSLPSSRFRANLEIVDCEFYNSAPGFFDQASPDSLRYDYAAAAVAATGQAYGMDLIEQTAAGQPVTQPTAEQMLRTFQAYMSIIDCITIHPVSRTLSAMGPVVQLRISVIATTFAVVFVALGSVLFQHHKEPRDSHQSRMHLPSSQFDWAVQTAQEHLGDYATEGYSSGYVNEHRDLRLAISKENGTWITRISTDNTSAISLPNVNQSSGHAANEALPSYP